MNVPDKELPAENDIKLNCAAPELLQALKECYNLFEAEYEDLSDQGKRARESAIAAIKKTTE